MNLTQQLDVIARAASDREAENLRFRELLKQQPPAALDALVQELDQAITPQIDCTQCGNCCRSLLINVTEAEVQHLAAHLQQPVASVQEQYIETSTTGSRMVINAIPCHFLSGNCCSIYAHRFKECREFPALHQPGFQGRLFATFMHYGRCPIVFHVIEQLKKRLSFDATPL